MIAGTWSIDAVLADVALPGTEAMHRGIHGRRFVDGERAVLTSSSPAGTPLLDRIQLSTVTHQGGWEDHMDGILNRPSTRHVAELPVVVPSLRGLGTSQDAGASVLGLSAHHDASTVGRALVEAMAFRHRLGCQLLSEHTEIVAFRVAGGLARSDLWTQFLSDALGRAVYRPGNPEAGAAGAAAMAGVAAGTWRSIDDAARAVSGAGSMFHPRGPAKGEIDVRYARYLAAIDRLVPT
jgi:sugar (pentulose or hexulose) kinase